MQAYVFEILAGIVGRRRRRAPPTRSTAACRSPATCSRSPQLADTLERLAAEGAEPFYRGRHRRGRRAARSSRGGGMLTPRDLRAYEVVGARAGPRRLPRAGDHHQPAAVGGRDADRGRAGGARRRARDAVASRLVAALEHAQRRRTPEFLEQLGSTTHIAVIDADGLGVLGDVVQRRGVGPRGRRHGPAPQQHDGRAGPVAARVLHAPAGAAAAVDDVADDRPPRRRGVDRAGLGRAPTGSAARSCR